MFPQVAGQSVSGHGAGITIDPWASEAARDCWIAGHTAAFRTSIQSPTPESRLAAAASSGRSTGSETAVGPCHVAPPSEDHATRAASLFKPALAPAQASTMRFVASEPVGAPFAMSTLGTDARSVRAPVYPSITHRPESGSTKKHGSVFVKS